MGAEASGERGGRAVTVRIGLGHAHDLEGFVELLEAAAGWLWRRGIRQWEPGSIRGQRPLLSRWTASGFLVLARSGPELAGGCFLIATPDASWAAHADEALYLQKLAVSRSFAGRGLAQRLIGWCEAWTRSSGVSRLRLDCWDGNARLRAFYRGVGFREMEAVSSLGYAVRLFEKRLE